MIGLGCRGIVVSPEDEFVYKLKQCDEDAYELLVRTFERPLYRYFLASHGDAQLAGEQSADCFGDLVESIPKMTGGADQLRPFVFAVARNVLRRGWRRNTRASVRQPLIEAPQDIRPTPDVLLEANDEQARLMEAVQSLDPATRDVFLLRFVEELSIAEVAAAVGEPLGTVKSRLHRGRKQLLEKLKSTTRLP
jgi:RNA polymerase sigma-70 factor, ECF subfamily